MTNKHNFHDIVKIVSENSRHAELNGKLAVIRGMAQNEVTQEWSYGVSVCDSDGMVLRFYEKDLRATGKKANPNDFQTGESVKIHVDPETGEGRIVDPKDNK